MDDLISRQAAIDALKQQADTMGRWSERYAEQRKGVLTAVNIVEDLPPAQLGTNLAEVGTDCISRQAALDIFDDYNVAVENGQIEAYSRDRKRLCDLPPAQPQRTGKWIYHIDDLFPAESTQECDQCHSEQPLACDDNYCPNCGAKMTEGDAE